MPFLTDLPKRSEDRNSVTGQTFANVWKQHVSLVYLKV